MFATPLFRRFAVAVVTAGVVEAHAVEQEFNAQHTNTSASVVDTNNTPKPPLLLEQLESKFVRRADEVFTDQLHPFNAMKWNIMVDQDSERIHERSADAAQRAFSKSVEYGVRDAIVDLPVMRWLEERQEFVADLLRDSVDSVEEESVAPLDGSYLYGEQAWWQEVSRRRRVRYGVRPFTTSPYTFMSFAFRDRENIYLLGHLRYYYDHYSDHRFEVAVSLPLAYGVTMGLGTSYQFGRHDEKQRVGIKLFKEFSRNGIAHVGFELREHPTLLTGISFRW